MNTESIFEKIAGEGGRGLTVKLAADILALAAEKLAMSAKDIPGIFSKLKGKVSDAELIKIMENARRSVASTGAVASAESHIPAAMKPLPQMSQTTNAPVNLMQAPVSAPQRNAAAVQDTIRRTPKKKMPTPPNTPGYSRIMNEEGIGTNIRKGQ